VGIDPRASSPNPRRGYPLLGRPSRAPAASVGGRGRSERNHIEHSIPSGSECRVRIASNRGFEPPFSGGCYTVRRSIVYRTRLRALRNRILCMGLSSFTRSYTRSAVFFNTRKPPSYSYCRVSLGRGVCGYLEKWRIRRYTQDDFNLVIVEVLISSPETLVSLHTRDVHSCRHYSSP
jgi:hypothetical protein